ncbi:cell division protein, partial [Corynebacterium bovis]
MSFDDPSVPEEPYVLPPEPPAEDDLPPEPVTGAPGRPAAPGRHAGAP